MDRHLLLANDDAFGKGAVGAGADQCLRKRQRHPGDLSMTRIGSRDAITLFHPIRMRRSFEDVIAQITELIRSGDLQVGDRLPSERLLAARLDVSRPTLREGVKILTEIDVVAVRRGSAGGVFVKSEIIPRSLVEEQSRLRLSEVAEVLEARRVFEPRVARVAAVHARREDFEIMASLIELLRGARNDRTRIGQYDLRFHLAIARATHNSSLVAMMRLLQHDLELVRDMAIRDPFGHEWTITIHERTMDAIRRGDPDLIDHVMDEHLSFLERVWQEEMGLQVRRGFPGIMSAAEPDG